MGTFFVLAIEQKIYSPLISDEDISSSLSFGDFQKSTRRPPVIAPNPANCINTKTGLVLVPINDHVQVDATWANDMTSIITVIIIAETR
jgi:hypothetical protein